MPYLVGLFGMYCFGPNRPRNPTMVSSTAFGGKALLEVSDEEFQDHLHLVDPFLWKVWITVANVEHPENLLKSLTREHPAKNGIALSQFVLQYDVMSGTWMTPMFITTARKPSISLFDTGFYLAKRDRGVSLFWSRRCSIPSAAYLWNWCSLFTLKLVPRS